ncbi:MAG: ABC transporter permease [Clostridia bacterium]|nr:ABC transporter permease [Clostridia bacterium]
MKILKELYDYREMIFNLVKKELRGRYKGSVLGFLWTFINPLFQLIIYTIVFSYIMRSGIDKYYLFLFVALIPWIFFQTSLQGGAASIITQKSLVTKIYFPREVIPVSFVTSCFMNMLFCFVIIFIVVGLAGVKLSLLGLLCLPIVMLVEYLLALGFTMIASAVTVYFRDFEHILGIIVMAWMYLTPIIFALDIVPDAFMPIFKYNPLTYVIEAYRDILYAGGVPQMSELLYSFIVGVVVVVIGFIVFAKLKRHFAEEL